MNRDIRDGFFDEISEIATKDPRMIVVSDDMDVFSLRDFKAKNPHRFVNVGVAEQNMINVAAGLASCGRRVLVYGIASFVVLRCFEQIKFSICSMNLPVTIVGIGSGVSFSFDGPTHHGIHDLAVMRTLPEMSIFNPCDSVSAMLSAKYCMLSSGPSYVKIDKGTLPTFYSESDTATWKFVWSSDKEICLVSTGYFTQIAETVGKRLNMSVIDICQIKPLSMNLINTLKKFHKIISFEENVLSGGLGTALLEAGLSVDRLAMPDRQLLLYGQRHWFHSQFRLDENSLEDYLRA